MNNDSNPNHKPSQEPTQAQSGSVPERQVAREAGQSTQEQQEISENNGNPGQYPTTGQQQSGTNPATGLPHQVDPASEQKS